MKAKLRAVILAVALVTNGIGASHAGVLTAYDELRENIQPLPKDGAVWVKCRGCNDAMRSRLIQGLMKNGYAIVDEKASSKYTLVLGIGVTIPGDGKTRYVYAEEAYGAGIPPIAPAIKALPDLSNRATNQDYSGGLSAAETSNLLQASHTFGGVNSYGGGVGVAIVGNILASIVGKNINDAKRIPGVANTGISIVANGKNGSFTVIAAANTPETPEALIDASIDAAVQGIVNGIKQGKDGGATPATKNAEQSNIVTATQQQDTQ